MVANRSSPKNCPNRRGQGLGIFSSQFPDAVKRKFIPQVDFDDNRKATVEIFFKEGPGSLKSVFGTKSKYWPLEMKSALGFKKYVGFPLELTLYPAPAPQTIPAVKIGETLNKSENIYITPTDVFTTKYRKMFKDTQITFRTSKNARK